MKKGKTPPPGFSLKLLKWYCKPEYHPDIEGDLIELFDKRVQSKGLKKARWLLLKDVLLLFRPGIIKSLARSRYLNPWHLNHYDMFKNSLKIGFRNLVKRKEYTGINVLGLAVGIASCLLIVMYVQYECSYDKFLVNADRIYKMVVERKKAGAGELDPKVAYSFTRTMVADYEEVENATAIAGPYHSQLIHVIDQKNGELRFLENSGYYADNNFFSVFSFKMLRGNPETALQKPNSVVLTASTAKRYFGGGDPLQRPVTIGNKTFTVTGVCEDPPKNSHFEFNYIGSSASIGWFNLDDFNLATAHCYFKLASGASPWALESKFPKMIKTYMPGEIEKVYGLTWEGFKKAGNGLQYFLRPITSLHLDPANLGGFKPGGSKVTVRILMAIAILIFVIACVNFINLATARSTERAKEVGVRKAMGSFQVQLVFQFLTESFILSFMGLALAVGLIVLALPYFNALTGKGLEIYFSVTVVSGLLLLGVCIGFLAGLYPSFVLSAFKPVNVLKGNLTTHLRGRWIRNGLVVFQFWISIVLIISTLIIQKQISYLADKDLGFDKEQIMVIEGTFHKDSAFIKPFLDGVENLSQVKVAAGSNWVQGIESENFNGYRLEGSQETFTTTRAVIGNRFAEVLGLKLIEGRFFSENRDDSRSVLVNESAVKSLGLKEPIGKKIVQVMMNREIDFTIAGVINDFNYQTLHEEVKPLVIQSTDRYRGRMKYIVVKIEAGATREAVAQIETKWDELVPGRPFSFRFLDETLDAKYRNEQRAGLIFTLFSGLSIFIAAMGLFALSSYTVSMRTKEIGIRKVVGAGVGNIMFLLSANFVKMILISFLMAIPVGWYVMDVWLRDFAFRTDITINVFILSGALALIITWVTVSVQCFKAANINPVDSLRDE